MSDNNPYLDLMQSAGQEQQTAPEETNPYQALMEEEAQARKVQQAGQLALSVKTNPDQYANQRRVAQSMGYPTAAVEALPDLEAQAKVRQVQHDTSGQPLLQQRYADADFAKLAHDDSGSLSKLGKWFSGAGSQLKASGHSGVLSLLGAGSTILDAVNPFTTSAQDAAVLFKNDPEGLRKFLNENSSAALTRFSRAMQQGSDEAAQDLNAQAKASYGNLRYATTNTDNAAYLSPIKIAADALQSLPTTLALGVSAYFTRGQSIKAYEAAIASGATVEAATAAAVQIGASTMAVTSAATEGAAGAAQQFNTTESKALTADLSKSPRYQELLNQGYTPEAARELVAGETATMAGQIAGVVDSVTNLVGGRLLGKLIAEGGSLPTRVIKGAAEEAVTEFVQSMGEQFGENWAEKVGIDPNTDLMKDVLEAGIAGLVVGGVTGGAFSGAAGRTSKQNKDVERGLANAENLQAALQAAAQSKLRERSPETFSQLVQQMADGTEGAPKSVFIDASVLAQSGLNLQQVLPSVHNQMAEALATNGTVEVPISEVLAAAPGTPLEQLFVEHARSAPDALSQSEAKQASQQAEQFLKTEAERVLKQAGDQAAWQQSAESVKSTLVQQLNEAGRFTPEVNDAYATLVRDFYSVTAQRVGMTPEQLYQQYPLQVGAAQPAGAVLNAGGITVEMKPDSQFLSAKSDVGQVGGHVRDGALHISYAEVSESARGKGEGIRLYSSLIDKALADGLKVFSDSTVEADAVHVYDALRRRGYDVRRLDGGQIQDGAAFGKDAKAPAFEVAAGPQILNQSAINRRSFLIGTAATLASVGAATTVGKAQPVSETVVNGDLPAEIAQVLIGDGTTNEQGAQALRQAVSMIAESGPKELRALASQIVAILPQDGVLLTVDDTANVGSHGEVHLKPDLQLILYTGHGSKGLRYSTVLHESLHVAVAARYKALYEGVDRSNDQALGREAPQAAEELEQFRQLWAEFGDVAKPAMQTLNKNDPVYYALKHASSEIDEFFVRALTDPHLQSWMSQRQYQGKTLWDRFRSWVKSALLGLRSGGTAPSWLDAALLASDDLIAQMSKDKADLTWLEASNRMEYPQVSHRQERVPVTQSLDENGLPQFTSESIYIGFAQPTERMEYIPEDPAREQMMNMHIYGPNNQYLGYADLLFVDGKLKALYDIEITDTRRAGAGSKVIETLLAANPSDTIEISNIVTAARGFWAKMGVPEQDLPDGDAYDGKLNWNIYAAARSSKNRGGTQGLVRGVPQEGGGDTVGAEARDDSSRPGAVRAVQEGKRLLNQGARATFSPDKLFIALGENADLTSFLHESGHFFLEVMADLASQPNAPAEIVQDMDKLLAWFGIKGDEQDPSRKPLEVWRAMSLEQKRRYHEKFAESFEQYLIEGKAPSQELKPLFRRFRAWMVSVYRSLSDFMRGRNLKLSDEVRGVFDRMLATDEQIQQAEQAAGMLPDFEATNEAIEKLQARSIRDLKWAVNARSKALKKLQRQATSLRKEVEAEVKAEVQELPVVQAKKDVMALEKRNPSDFDLRLAIIAEAHGYESPEALMHEIDRFGPVKDHIERMTTERMLQRHGDLATTEAIEAAANEAVHNEARARALATELKAQSDALNPRQQVGRDKNGRAITVNALGKAASEFAKDLAARRLVKDLKSAASQHRAAEARAGKAWQKATTKGNTQEAVQAKRDQLLNNASAKALMEAQEEVQRIQEFFGKVTKGTNAKLVERGRDPDVVNAMRAILSAYGVAPKLEKNALAYMEAVATHDPAMFAALNPSVQVAMQNARPWGELTMEELRGLKDELDAMWFLAKRSRQMEVDGNLIDLDEAAGELMTRMEEIGIPKEIPGERGAITDKEERGIKLRFFKAILSRVEQWSERLDGKFGGPFLRLVFQPVKDAADRYRTDKVKYREKFTKLLQAVAPAMKPGQIDAPELGYKFGNARDSGVAELLHAILHTGNDSNKRKLLLGRGWATERPNGELDTSRWDAFLKRMYDEGKLTKAHWDFAQGVWDLLEEMKPKAQETHRRVFGRYFDEVTANTVQTPFGVYRGGYVPAQTDSRLVKDAKLRELSEGENESMAYAFPSSPSGFTKARVEYNKPLLLDLRALAQHMDKVLLFSHMQGAVVDARRLLTEKNVSTALDRIDPGAYEGMLIPWLNRAAKQIVETPVAGDRKLSRFLSAARSRAGMAMMFANLSNTVQQITGFSSAAVKVKPSLMLKAAASFVAAPREMKKTVAESSEFMRNRMLNEVAAMNDAVEQILIDPTLIERGQAWTNRHAYFLQSAVDNTMSPIIWTAAYNQAIEQGHAEKDAIRFADGVVRQTQGTTLPEDISRFESGPAYARLFTQFIGYFNMMANTNATAITQIANEMGLKRGAGKLLYVALAGLLVPIWVAEAIAVAFRGGPGDDDDDGYLDDWLMAVFGMGTLRGLTAQIPIVGQSAQLVVNRFNSKPADDKFSLSPAVSLIESAVGAPASVYKAIVNDGSAQKAVRDVAAAATLLTGLPFYAAARPAGYMAGVSQGKVQPANEVDMARGVITGSVSQESRRP